MEDFRIIYRILKYLQQSMDFEEFDCAGFTAERFGTNPNRFQALLIQLQKAGFIEGLNIVRYIRQPERIASYPWNRISPCRGLNIFRKTA